MIIDYDCPHCGSPILLDIKQPDRLNFYEERRVLCDHCGDRSRIKVDINLTDKLTNNGD